MPKHALNASSGVRSVEEPNDERVDQMAQKRVPEAENGWVWISPLCGAAEQELNIRGHDQGHERVKRVVLRIVAAMVARGVQAGDLEPVRGADALRGLAGSVSEQRP